MRTIKGRNSPLASPVDQFENERTRKEDEMIELHRLNKEPFMLNHRHIETIEALPDTVITLINEKKYIVKETPEQILERIVAYHRKIFKTNLPESVDI